MIKNNSILILFFLFTFAPLLGISQTSEGNILTKAIKLLDNGNFVEAELLFKKVLDEKPADFMVNYFYGACRTENNHFTNSDLDCLILANQEVSPININYYFGIQYHARSNWERALKFYNKYKSTASLSESDKQKILEKIQQCYDKINHYEEFVVNKRDENITTAAITNIPTNKIDSTETKLEYQDSVIENEILLVTDSTTIPEPEIESIIQKDKSINFTVNSEITYLCTSHFKTDDGKAFFMKGDSLQKELDFNLTKTDELRENYSSAKTREEKNSIGQEILTNENEMYQLKSDATQFLVQAKNIETKYWENATNEEIEKFNNVLNQIPEENKIEKVEIDTTTFIDPNILLGNKENTSSQNELDDKDIIYKIQIGAYRRGLPNYVKRLFDKLSLIRKIENYTDEKGVVVYTTGNLTKYEDAVIMQNQVRQEGIKDAYVVPYFKGKRITLKQAKEL